MREWRTYLDSNILIAAWNGAEHPRVAALREFITDWYVSYLSIDQTRNQPEAGPQERLSKGGENLANVI